MRHLTITLLGAGAVAAALFSAGGARAESAGWICDLHWRLADSPLSPLGPFGRGARIAEYRWYVSNCSGDRKRLERARKQIADYENRRNRKQKAAQPNPSTSTSPPPALLTPPPPPSPPPPPVLKAAAVVDSDGGGDAQSITEALALVREGATIRIHPGRYNEDLTITKSVKLVGDRAAPPILVGSIVSVGKDVTLQSLKLESRHRDGTLRLESGTLRLVDCQVQNNGGVALDRALTPAVAVTGGVLEIEGGVVGPGPDAAIVVSASGRLWIHDDGNVRGNTGYGIYVTGQSEVNISHSQLSGSIAVVAHRRTNLVLTDTALIGTQGKPVVSLWDQTVAEILNNKVEIAAGDQARIPADRNWIWISRSVSHRIEGNVTTKGKRLPEPKSQGAGPDDEVRPNLKRRRAG